MKSITLLFLVLLLNICASAQRLNFKAGGSFNSEIVLGKVGQINYPAWEFCAEKLIGKKFSISTGFYFAKRDYKDGFNDASNQNLFIGTEWIHYDQSVYIEGRYYLKSNAEGLFIQAAIPFIYSTEKRYSSNIYNKDYFALYTYAICTLAGIGIKYPVSSKFGVEMNAALSPSLNLLNEVDYGTSGYFKTGLKLFYSL